MKRRLAWLGLCLALTSLPPALACARDAAIDRSYRIPYRITDTNHFLVRVRINGKGPFNFLVDTGAPALYISTETARKVGLDPEPDEFWTPVDRIDLEGGARLEGIKGRVEDPFQLVGMNALGLPGASIDGILGFTVLARFRIELDLTKDRMVWTRLDFEPRDPPVPPRGARGRPPAEMQAMNALGPLAKVAALLVGKQPEEQLHPRGFLGLVVAEAGGMVRVAGVLADSPAAKAGVQPGDRLIRLNGRGVATLPAAFKAVAEVQAGKDVALTVRRGETSHELILTAGEGL